jgi:hypothetical protein
MESGSPRRTRYEHIARGIARSLPTTRPRGMHGLKRGSPPKRSVRSTRPEILATPRPLTTRAVTSLGGPRWTVHVLPPSYPFAVLTCRASAAAKSPRAAAERAAASAAGPASEADAKAAAHAAEVVAVEAPGAGDAPPPAKRARRDRQPRCGASNHPPPAGPRAERHRPPSHPYKCACLPRARPLGRNWVIAFARPDSLTTRHATSGLRRAVARGAPRRPAT